MSSPPSLQLILARELASNLATPMFLIDAQGILVFYNEAAEVLIGKPFAELGEMDALEWGALLQMTETDGTPVRRRSPSRLPYATSWVSACLNVCSCSGNRLVS